MSEIEKIEEETFSEVNIPQIPPPDIVAYNELRSCADLYRMYRTGILNIQPDFQREIVWNGSAQTRFIDSLVKQLPIPSMCFSLDYKAQKWMVIDGLQRMATIIKFLSGESGWKLSKLDDIDPSLSGKNISSFLDKENNLHRFYTAVENLSLPVTVLRCDFSKQAHTEYLFTIFHRLNTGGMKLNNQEIRNCIFSGSFNNLLKELNKDINWKSLNKMKSERGHRFTKQELILRFFAFYDNYKGYNGYLSRFLNDYMKNNSELDENTINVKTLLFKGTVDLIYNKIFEGKVTSKLGISLQEALLVGVAKNLKTLNKLSGNQIKNKYNNLLQHEELSEIKLSEGLSGKNRVQGRIKAGISIFSSK